MFVLTFLLYIFRYIAICMPFKRPEMCTTRRAKIVVTALTAFGLLAYASSLWTSAVQRYGQKNVCAPVNDYVTVHLVVTYGDIIITLFIPFLTILVLNVIITYKVAYFYSGRKNKELQRVNSTSSTSTAKSMVTESRGKHIRTGVVAKHVTFSKTCLGERAQIKLTKFLLIISTVYLAINLPSYVIRLRLLVKSFTQYNSKPTPWEQLMEQLQLLFQYIFYLNFAINFFLYSLFSVKFREALCRLAWQMKYKWQSFKEWSYRVLARNSSDSSLAAPDVGPASPRIVAVDELEFAKMITPKRST